MSSHAHEHPPRPHSHGHDEPSSPSPIARGGLYAVLAALAFGVTTPLIQKLGRDAGAFPTACLLYAGAALATVGDRGARDHREASLTKRHVPRVALVALFGAVLAPASLAWGLQHATATSSSLLLNLEAVFTVLLAWRLYKEPIGRRAGLALALMVLGGACLVVSPAGASGHSSIGLGSLAVIAATFAWALDNTLTRPLSDHNPAEVVRFKGAVGAVCSWLMSLALGQRFPALPSALGLLACGMTGYGLSLRLYILAQRRIGAARTGSIFAVAPFVGALAAWILGDRSVGHATVIAATLFALGVFLHLTEKHRHRHAHDAVDHEHAHRHDDGHHDHTHDPPFVGEHSHPHHHDAKTHDHPHAPDVHHQHRHA